VARSHGDFASRRPTAAAAAAVVVVAGGALTLREAHTRQRRGKEIAPVSFEASGKVVGDSCLPLGQEKEKSPAFL